MSIVKWTPEPFNCDIDLIKALSVRHKYVSWDERLIVQSSIRGSCFTLTFRNYYKQRMLSIVLIKDNVKIVVERNNDGYITGHEFIAFIKIALKTLSN